MGAGSLSGMIVAIMQLQTGISMPSALMPQATPSGARTAWWYQPQPWWGGPPPKQEKEKPIVERAVVIPEPNSNSLLVRGPKAEVAKAVALIKRLDAGGNPQWTANGMPVIATADYDECAFSVPDGAGGAIIMSYYGAVNRIAADRTLPWGPANNPVVYSTSGSSWGPKLMSDGQGGAILTWIENVDTAVQRVDNNGNLLWNGGNPVLLTTTGASECPRIISDGAGGAIIMWTDNRNMPDQIYAQRVNSNGATQWTANGIQVTDADIKGYSHGLASDAAGGAFVTWFDSNDDNLYAQRINSNGNHVWAAAAQLTTTGDYDDTSDPPRKTVEDGSGGFVTVWVNDSYKIMAQRVSGNGNVQWTANGVVLSNAAGSKECSRIEGNGHGGSVAIWRDNRNSAITGQDIYMQGVDLHGNLGNPQAPAATVPTLNEWGIIILSLLMAGAALWTMRRREVAG